MEVYSEPLARRPGGRQSGRPSQLRVNYFPIKFANTGTVHHYDVSITPEVPPKVNKEIFHYFESQHHNNGSTLNGIRIVFDGAKNAFTPRALPFGPSLDLELTLPERGGRPNPKRPPRVFNFKLVKVNEVAIDINEINQRTPSGLTALMAYNIVFRHQPNTEFVQVRDSFFIRKDVKTMNSGVEVWPGYSRSVMPVSSGLALNVDTIVCTFYRPGNLLDLLMWFAGLRSRDELRDQRISQFYRRFKSFIKGLRIVLNYRGESNNKDFKIQSFSETPAGRTTFDLRENDGTESQQITVADYYAKKLGIRLNFPNLPCVEIKKGALIPLELCEVIPGQRYPKKLTESQTAEMIKITCIKPDVRSRNIMDGLRLMDFGNNEYLRQFGLSVDPQLITTPSRLLPVPTLHYNSSSREKSLQPMDGGWNLRDKRLFQGKTLERWGVLVFANETRLKRTMVEAFVSEFVRTSRDTGMNIVTGQPKIVYHQHQSRPEATLQDFFYSIGNEFNGRPDLIMCVLPDKGADLYNTIKTTCEVKLGVVTQCVQAEKVTRPNRQYCANVCLKVNTKLGGVSAAIHPDELGNLKQPITLLVGADVSHPQPGADGAPSVASLVGSLDFNACRYCATVRLQKGRFDLVADLQAMLVEILKMFYKETGKKPERILYFRDGISEGGFQRCLIHEMSAIKKACASLEKEYSPKVTFTVSQKRHHTRFFPFKREDQDRSGNCKAGTLVDSGICHPSYFDFFLQSHGGLQGTSRPVHYHVLIDENKWDGDDFQRLCYFLCYLFCRATRSVSLVPPIYYAHLAATRARCHNKLSEGSDSASVSTHGASSSLTEVLESRSVVTSLMKTMYYV